MATFTLTTPVRVGDLENGTLIDKMDLVSISMNFQGPGITVSVMFQHQASGFVHTITLTGADGTAAMAALRAAFPTLETAMMNYIISKGKLPPGTVS